MVSSARAQVAPLDRSPPKSPCKRGSGQGCASWDLDDDQSLLGVQTPKNRNFWGVNRYFKPNRHIFKIMQRICIKFNELMWPNEKTSWVALYDDASIPRWRTAAILDFDFGP